MSAFDFKNGERMSMPYTAQSAYVNNMRPTELAALRNQVGESNTVVKAEVDKSIANTAQNSPHFCQPTYQAGFDARLSNESILSFDNAANTFAHAVWLKGFIDADIKQSEKDSI